MASSGNFYPVLETFVGKSPRDAPQYILRRFRANYTASGANAHNGAIRLFHESKVPGTGIANVHQVSVIESNGGSIGENLIGDSSGAHSMSEDDIFLASAIHISNAGPQDAAPGTVTVAVVPSSIGTIGVGGTHRFNAGYTSAHAFNDALNSQCRDSHVLGQNSVVVRDVCIPSPGVPSGTTKVVIIEGLTSTSSTFIAVDTYVLQRVRAVVDQVLETVVDEKFSLVALRGMYTSNGAGVVTAAVR
jgi:hypothetical protein